MLVKVLKYVVEIIDVNLMFSIYKYLVYFDIINSLRVSFENFKLFDFKKGSMYGKYVFKSIVKFSWMIMLRKRKFLIWLYIVGIGNC